MIANLLDNFRMVERINVRCPRPPRGAHIRVQCRDLAETPHFILLQSLGPPALPALHSPAPCLHHLGGDSLPLQWKIP